MKPMKHSVKRISCFGLKICRKESKESMYWLKLIDIGDDKTLRMEKERLQNESKELMMIFGAIIRKTDFGH